MTVEKPKPKQLLRTITTGAGSTMNQSQLLAITCNALEAREKSRVHGGISFGFASHRLKNWRASFEPITKRSNRSRVISFDSHLKTALKSINKIQLATLSRCPAQHVITTVSLTPTVLTSFTWQKNKQPTCLCREVHCGLLSYHREGYRPCTTSTKAVTKSAMFLSKSFIVSCWSEKQINITTTRVLRTNHVFVIE